MIAIVVLFLIPLFYLAKSKGFSAGKLVAIATLLSLSSGLSTLLIDSQALWLGQFIFPAIILLATWIIPAKEGAPGKAYLKISFTCPECKEEVTFERRFEGRAELCPKCGEIITVPLDEFSPKPKEHTKIKPALSEGQVCFADFGDEMAAIQLTAMLEDSGIKTNMISGIGGGTLPQLGGTQGFKVVIDAGDWDAAVEIEKNANNKGIDAHD